MFRTPSLTVRSSRWTKRAARPSSYSKESTRAKRNHQSFTTHSICSNSTARIFKICRSKSERQNGGAAEEATRGNSIFGLFYKDIPELLDRARKLGLEGLIGKRACSRYEAGKRSVAAHANTIGALKRSLC